MDVLGENEALQQFFSGQDVSGVLENAAVDTSMLEQYLSNDIDPSSFMLPESPPDSGSEPYSPPQLSDVHYSLPSPGVQTNPSVPSPTVPSPGSCSIKGASGHLMSRQHPHSALMSVYHVSDPCPSGMHPVPYCGSYHSVDNSSRHLHALPVAHMKPLAPSCTYSYLATISSQPAGSSLGDSKKRRYSQCLDRASAPQMFHQQTCTHSQECSNGSFGGHRYDSDVSENVNPGQGENLLVWKEFQLSQWSAVYNSSYQSLPAPAYHVDTDKGFSYSCTDEAFVCQKKNHFQVTLHVGVSGRPTYVKTTSGPKAIESFEVKVFGVKLEAQNHVVPIEQSQSDRSKKPFHPIRVSLPEDKITKVTLGRLHFGETTANNMRKKGKPNPEQRYFLLVVGLYACSGEEKHLLVAHVSEKIIVRASNPGQFENDGETLWQRGTATDTAVCHGRVGINTDTPDEALVVCGNVKVMGTVMHPSDSRAKHNIHEVDTTEQLKRIAQMRIVEYDYKPEFASKMGISQVHETGIIAQEVKELLPAAVKEVGDVICSDGERIHRFLMVDKEQIFMENVGAVKQLCKLTNNLETRIQELEGWNKHLSKLKSMGSIRSSHSSNFARKASKHNSTCPVSPQKKPAALVCSKTIVSEKLHHCLQHKAFQATVIALVATMAFCIISMTALYLLTLQEDNGAMQESSSTTVPPYSAIPPVTVPATPNPWPLDLDFCSLLYCDEVYCCPPQTGNHTEHTATSSSPTSSTPSPTKHPSPDTKKDRWLEILKGTKDWTNTTISAIVIKENQHVIDHRYCREDDCGSGNYSFIIPISKFVPVNMRVTLQMNTTELLVVHLCHAYDTGVCSATKDYSDTTDGYMSNTQGYNHEWPLPVARLRWSSYHFRATVAGQANCSTDPNYAEILFTDYHFHFYRRCY